jgi:hypothetical protein
MSWNKAWRKILGDNTNKYGNKFTLSADGGTFQSKKERDRYEELRLLERAEIISDLKTQVRFVMAVNGNTICTYVADFTYNESGKQIAEDAKGCRTPVYNIKAKLFKAIYTDWELKET